MGKWDGVSFLLVGSAGTSPPVPMHLSSVASGPWAFGSEEDSEEREAGGRTLTQ